MTNVTDIAAGRAAARMFATQIPIQARCDAWSDSMSRPEEAAWHHAQDTFKREGEPFGEHITVDQADHGGVRLTLKNTSASALAVASAFQDAYTGSFCCPPAVIALPNGATVTSAATRLIEGNGASRLVRLANVFAAMGAIFPGNKLVPAKGNSEQATSELLLSGLVTQETLDRLARLPPSVGKSVPKQNRHREQIEEVLRADSGFMERAVPLLETLQRDTWSSSSLITHLMGDRLPCEFALFNHLGRAARVAQLRSVSSGGHDIEPDAPKSFLGDYALRTAKLMLRSSL